MHAKGARQEKNPAWFPHHLIVHIFFSLGYVGLVVYWIRERERMGGAGYTMHDDDDG